jgi:glycosyltransferase involved in cell wall biosynthesis
MRVLVLQENYPPAHSGAGIDIKRTYEYICSVKKKMHVTILSRQSKHKLQPESRILVKNILPKWEMKNLFNLIKTFFLVIKEIVSSDIIHFNSLYPLGLLLIPIANIFGKITILQIHVMDGDEPTSVKKRKFGWLLYLFYSKAKYYKTYSKAQTDDLVNNGVKKERVYQVPPFIDTDIFFPASEDKKNKIKTKYSIPKNSKIITTVGRVGLRKGTDVFIDLFYKMKNDFDVIFLVVGPEDITEFYDEESSSQLSKNVAVLKATEERFKFLGELKNIDEIFKISDYFVLPSRSEGFGIVLIEAMACGIPTIVSNLENIFDQIISNKKDGFIINSYDSRDYLRVLSYLISDENEYKKISNNCAVKANKVYAPQNTLANYIDLIC